MPEKINNDQTSLTVRQVDELTKAVRAYRAAQEGDSNDSEHEAASWLALMVEDTLGIESV